MDTVIGVLMAEDLSPAVLASLKAEALGFSKAIPTKKQTRAGKPVPTSDSRSQLAAAAALRFPALLAFRSFMATGLPSL